LVNSVVGRTSRKTGQYSNFITDAGSGGDRNGSFDPVTVPKGQRRAGARRLMFVAAPTASDLTSKSRSPPSGHGHSRRSAASLSATR
jgi:hypothetical protein